VMIVNLQIPVATDLQVKQAVLGEELKHVLEKRQTDGDRRLSRAVQIEIDAHVRFFRLAMNVCDSRLERYFIHRFHRLLSRVDRSLLACRH